MCDESTLDDDAKYLQASDELTRRRLAKAAAGAGLAMLLPPVANALEITESVVTIVTADGSADCHFAHPATGKHPAVLVWPDILGLRPVFKLMGKRLAQHGYAVLTVNPFYRSARAPVVPAGASFRDPDVRAAIMPMRAALTTDANFNDARAFIAWLDQQAAVDTRRGIGTTGYCMGGPIVMRTASIGRERIRAGATFHGGGLVTDSMDSPHRLIPGIKAQMLHAVAENDHERSPDTNNVLAQAYRAASLKAEIEVYEGAMHGWCMADFPVYNEPQAEKAWGRLLALFDTALA